MIEKESCPGGLASTITDDKGFSWDLGVHVTGASKFKSFINVIKESVPEWRCIKKVVKVEMSHILNEEKEELNYIPYPVQSSIPYFPDELKNQCLNELNQMSESDQRSAEFNNFDEFSKHFFGPTLQDIFIRPYNEKVSVLKY